MSTITITIDGNQPFDMELTSRDDLRPGYVEITNDTPWWLTVTQDAWDFIVDLIEYSMNEGGDRQRTVEAGEFYPAFSFRVN